jgi:hypothetical protein
MTSFSIYEASAPAFVNSLTNIPAWLDKALAEGKSEADIIGARLAPNMAPLSGQIQMASDTAKSAIARLAGIEPPSMPDTETTIAELKERCAKTIAFIKSVDRSALDGAEDREVVLMFPNGMGYRFTGRAFLTGFALPNFYFHVTTAYALLRAQGVTVGKPDFLAHVGPPNIMPAA